MLGESSEQGGGVAEQVFRLGDLEDTPRNWASPHQGELPVIGSGTPVRGAEGMYRVRAAELEITEVEDDGSAIRFEWPKPASKIGMVKSSSAPTKPRLTTSFLNSVRICKVAVSIGLLGGAAVRSHCAIDRGSGSRHSNRALGFKYPRYTHGRRGQTFGR